MGGVTCHGYSWKCMRLTSPRHAGTQGMGWLAEIRGKHRRLLLYVSRKSTSGVFYSLSFSQHHLPKFSGFVSLLPSIHFPQHDPSSFQWLRDGVHLSPPHTSPKETPACCELGKQRRASTNHFKWLFEWEIMENATLILSPHPCNTGEHHIGDVSAHGKYYCNGLRTAQSKDHMFIFKLGTTWKEYSKQWTKTVHDP